MAVTAFWYGLAIRDQWNTVAADRVDYLTDTIKASLHTNTYAPNQDTDQYFSTVTNELTTSGNYTAGGITLAGKTLTYDGPSNTIRIKANDLVWTALTPSSAFQIGVIRKDTGAAATSHLMGWTNFGATQNPGGIDFTWKGDPTDGFLRGVVS